MQHREFFFTFKKYTLFGQYWIPDHCEAIVLLVHGMGEHSSRYTSYVIPQLLANNIAVITYDNFGHGRSSGKRGHCPGYQALMDVVDIIFDKAQEIAKNLPIFLYGHSMGGNLVINYKLRNDPSITGAILSSPFLRLAFQPPVWKLVMGKVFLKLLPSITLPSGLDVNAISRVPEEVSKYLKDPLIHDKVSPMFSIPIIEAGAYAIEKASTLTQPVLLIHGTGDQITDYTASAEIAEKCSYAELITFEDGYHELHNDIEKDKFMKTVINWIYKKV